MGSYSDLEGATSMFNKYNIYIGCIICPSGVNTTDAGASNSADCKDMNDINIFSFISHKKTTLKINNSNKPLARHRHSVVLWNSVNMVIFGGSTRYKYNSDLNDLHLFSFVTNKWKALETFGVKPISRYGHASTIIGDVMYISGGYNIKHFIDFKDIHMINLRKLFWQRVDVIIDEKSPDMFQHSMSVV